MPTYNRSYRSGTTRRSSVRRTTTQSGTGWGYSSSRYDTFRREIQARISSYRAINQQFSGTSVTAFSPATANRWMKMVGAGARVYTFSPSEFCRYFGSQWDSSTPTAAFRYLRKKFGSGIKAVTRGRGNNWLVAATSNVYGRPFSTYQW